VSRKNDGEGNEAGEEWVGVVIFWLLRGVNFAVGKAADK